MKMNCRNGFRLELNTADGHGAMLDCHYGAISVHCCNLNQKLMNAILIMLRELKATSCEQQRTLNVLDGTVSAIA